MKNLKTNDVDSIQSLKKIIETSLFVAAYLLRIRSYCFYWYLVLVDKTIHVQNKLDNIDWNFDRFADFCVFFSLPSLVV